MWHKMNTGPHKLTPTDRARLCGAVDFPAVLAGDGVEVKRNGAAYVCKLRPEANPSCHVYPPGVGRRGADGWTFHDFGTQAGGDALAYLVDVRGLAFVDAVAELCNLTGWTPPGWEGAAQDAPRNAGRGKGRANMPPAPPAAPTVPTMAHEAHLDAAAAFVRTLLDAVPDAAAQGEAYLAGRGCLPDPWPGGAWLLPAEACKPLAADLAAGADADLLTRAGLLKPAQDGKPPRLAWWDAACLLGCYDAAGSLAYLVGRRLDWKAGDRWGKYINQPCAGVAVRLPFNLPALYAAAGRLDAAQTLAGHADPKTTRRAYARVQKGKVLRALAAVLDLAGKGDA